MMHNKKKPSLTKIKQDKLSSTARQMFWHQQNNTIAQDKFEEKPKTHAFKRPIKNVSSKVIEIKPRMQTQETAPCEMSQVLHNPKLNESKTDVMGISQTMFQSMYGGGDWLKPSDYIQEMGELNLLGSQKNIEAKTYDINLNDKMEKNLQKYTRLKEVTQKWVAVLKKALSYIKSTKTSTDNLIEEVKFWKVLSRKLDELEYEFKEQKTIALLNIMKNVLKTQPTYKPILDEFVYLKEQIIVVTPSVKRLYLLLQSIVSGFIIKLEQCSDICQSINLLKKILIGFDSLYQQNPLIKNRLVIIYQKIDQCMTQKLLATSLYPRQLANISSVKQNYQIMDSSLSFYSNFLNSLEGSQLNMEQLIEKVEYSRQTLANLLQILTYFEYLYNKKEVNEFSKLFSHVLNFNIYDRDYSDKWSTYMEMVNSSMEKYNFEP